MQAETITVFESEGKYRLLLDILFPDGMIGYDTDWQTSLPEALEELAETLRDKMS